MPRIVGVDIPNDKSIWISLTYIVGIGKYTSMQILKEAGIDKSTKAGKLSEDELISQNIARLRDINCYKGVRHRRGLPVHGQCTQSNARTRKGPRKTVAGKKGVKEQR
ncbi:MAG: 30S ribosomal protein S13 [Planctomycetota bacterium]|jgi:small subunit ribosomal protein S13